MCCTTVQRQKVHASQSSSACRWIEKKLISLATRVVKVAIKQLPLVAVAALAPSPFHLLIPATLAVMQGVLCCTCGCLLCCCSIRPFGFQALAQTSFGLYLRSTQMLPVLQSELANRTLQRVIDESPLIPAVLEIFERYKLPEVSNIPFGQITGTLFAISALTDFIRM